MRGGSQAMTRPRCERISGGTSSTELSERPVIFKKPICKAKAMRLVVERRCRTTRISSGVGVKKR